MTSEPVRDRVAVLIPGAQFGPHTPPLMYCSQAAQRRGARIQPMYWRPPSGQRAGELADWAAAEVTAVLDRVAEIVPGAAPLLIGKSLASQAATVAADRRLPAIWLTPLLHLDSVCAALARATAPALLVGGTADSTWDGAAARELSAHVLQIEHADHGLFLPGPLADSAAALGRVVTAVEEFIEATVWPAG